MQTKTISEPFVFSLKELKKDPAKVLVEMTAWQNVLMEHNRMDGAEAFHFRYINILERDTNPNGDRGEIHCYAFKGIPDGLTIEQACKEIADQIDSDLIS